MASGTAAATRAFELTQETEHKLGVVIYQRALPPGSKLQTPPAGLVFVAVRLEEAVESVLTQQPVPGVGYCLEEVTIAQPRGKRLAGLAQCPSIDLAGATSATLALSANELGQYLRVSLTGSGAYSGSYISAAVGPVVYAEAAPVASNVGSTGSAQVGQTMSGYYTYSDRSNPAAGGHPRPP